MKLKEFFRKARRGRKWRVQKDGWRSKVRCQDGDCPLTAVTGQWSIFDAADQAGLRYATAEKIAIAADDDRSKHRPWLLKHLGVRA